MKEVVIKLAQIVLHPRRVDLELERKRAKLRECLSQAGCRLEERLRQLENVGTGQSK
jgi:hypothetical protein